MKEMVRIEGKDLRRLNYRSQPVITLADVDNIHDRAEGTADQSFRRNVDRFQEGIDYFKVPYGEWKILVGSLTGNQKGGHKGEMIFLSLQGYCKIIKPFGDDQSWRIQQMLINNYFNVQKKRSLPTQQSQPTDKPLCRVLYHNGKPIHLLDFPPHGEVVVVVEVSQALGKSRGLLKEKAKTYPEAGISIRVLRGDEYSRFHTAFKGAGVPLGGNSIGICPIELISNLLLYGNTGKDELALWKTFNGYFMGTQPAIAMMPVYRQRQTTMLSVQ